MFENSNQFPSRARGTEEKNSSEEIIAPVDSVDEKREDPAPDQEDDILSGRIHTMPHKFHVGKGEGGRKNKLLIIAIIVIAIIILGILAAFLFQKIINPQAQTNSTQNLNVSNNNQNVNNANQNENKNLNGNLNQNVNQNQNSNQNTNQNNNQNVNNANQNTNLNANTNSNRNLNFNVNAPLPSSTDSDRDGLTDKEEEELGTNAQKPDSDSDGYSDGLEVASGYNPLGSGTLTSSSAIKIYTNDDYNYTILYPQNWLSQATNNNNKEVLFTADTAEFVEVLVILNPTSLTAKEWYLSQFPELNSQDLTTVTTWEGEEGIISPDGNTVYLGSNDYLYGITYNTGTKAEANFRKTFEMMYKSFKVLPEGITNTNLNTNSNQNLNLNQNNNSNLNSNSNLNTNSNQNLNYNSNSNNNSNSNSNLNSNANNLSI